MDLRGLWNWDLGQPVMDMYSTLPVQHRNSKQMQAENRREKMWRDSHVAQLKTTLEVQKLPPMFNSGFPRSTE